MRFFGASLAFALLIVVGVDAEKNDLCTSYYSSPGKCISIQECPSLRGLIPSNRETVNKKFMEILRGSHCGFIKMTPLVCCPDVDPPTTNSGEASTARSARAPPRDESMIVAPTRLPEMQSFETPPLVGTTTATTTELPPQESVVTDDLPTDHPLLPKECGRALNKHFFGNHTDFDDFPWTVLIAFDAPNGTIFGCGGSLISNRYVLTAGHCASSLDSQLQIKSVRIGEYDLRTENDCYSDDGNGNVCMNNVIDVGVEDQIVHPDYKPYDKARVNDIALLRLDREITFSEYVKPICLPRQPPVEQRFYTSGWGKTRERAGHDLKCMSYLTEVPQSKCFEKYTWVDVRLRQEMHICAGAKPTEIPCVGDEGGPLMGVEPRENDVHGVAVFGVFAKSHPNIGVCARSEWPGVYTKVYDYVPWIVKQLKP